MSAFDEHFRRRRIARHVVLCDTGLNGSALRPLRASHHDWALSCVMLARANYKNFASEHFEQTAGLIVERNGHSAFDVRSVVLRYWQLVEHVCAPPLESVKVFARDYLTRLNRGNYSERLFVDAPRAWRELRRRILWPSPDDRDLLAVGARGRDFGRGESVDALAPRPVLGVSEGEPVARGRRRRRAVRPAHGAASRG
jgi:hypothetical protein